jgi:hypothetical protein
MLLALKKSADKSDSKQALAWHPNFADVEKLPDVKVVRTKFFVNSASILVLCAVLFFVGKRELALYQLNNELVSVEVDISRKKPESDRSLAAYNKFKLEEKKLTEVLNLTADTFSFTDFILHLGDTLPDRITLQRITYRGPGQLLTMTVTVRGIDAVSSDIASAYVKQLQDDKISKEYFNEVVLSSIVRNASAQNLTMEISIAVKPLKK